jgi:hypothetical protein
VVGQTEKLVTEEDGKRMKKSVKMFAGAHDLRRAFCSRWAKLVMPVILQRLARGPTRPYLNHNELLRLLVGG